MGRANSRGRSPSGPLCALVVCGSGCNVLSLPFFLMGPEPSVPPKVKRLATDDKDKKIKVAVVASSNLEVRDHLARYKVPREVIFLDELPRNPTGKVLKRELREMEVDKP